MMRSLATVTQIAKLLRQRSQNAFGAIIGHHTNQKLAINRAAEAKAWGLLPVDWLLPAKDWPTPFTQQTITVSGDVVYGRWLRWLIATLLLAGLGGGWYVTAPWFASVTEEKTHTTEQIETILRGDADVEAGQVTVERK
jgi:hypothetical protein